MHRDECPAENVLEFDSKYTDLIRGSVDDGDLSEFDSSCDNALEALEASSVEDDSEPLTGTGTRRKATRKRSRAESESEMTGEMQRSLEEILETHSPEDLTPFVHHMYHGHQVTIPQLKQYNQLSPEDLRDTEWARAPIIVSTNRFFLTRL